jgi:hypothetical protein
MRKTHLAIIAFILTAQAASAASAATVTQSSDGWTVTADGEHGVLAISRDGLGTILNEVHLNLRDEHGLRRLNNWSAVRQGEDRISIRSSEPRSAWEIELRPEALEISTTSSEGLLTAEAPAPPDRIVARLMDPQGTPVNWMMTPETKHGYGGTEFSAPSFLPRRNPDVMYFALGQVASNNLYSLFDIKTDTVIEFSEQTVMQRQPHNTGLLDVSIPVPGNTMVRVIPDYFTKVLGVPHYVPFDDSYFSRAPMVWDSWSSYYEGVREEDVVRNADWIAEHLKAYGYQFVQLDDGYDRGPKGEHYWIGTWNQQKFPHGPKWLADHIKLKGLRAGVWLVPSAYAGAVEQHPAWYLRYKKNGAIILDYDTPTLDSTNPEVLDFLKKEFTTLDDWGFDYYKFDGEHDFLKYVPGVDLDKIADKNVDPIVAYRNRLKLIRETIGPRRFIEGCPAGTPLDGIGYFSSAFTGEDPYNSWQGMYSVFSSINANAFMNHLVLYVMPGESDVEPPMSVAEAMKRRPPSVVEAERSREQPLKGFGMTLEEARTVVSHIALSGVVYSLDSVLSELPGERVKLLKMTLPTMPIFPIDLFSRGTDMPMWDIFKHTTPDDYIHNYPEILDLKVNAPAGVYDVAAVTNWRSWTTTRPLAFADKLGLSMQSSYVVFDFWSQKLLGVFKGKMDVTVEPHDTRVLLIHPLLPRPQLVGTSRHISGAYSIQNAAWDGVKSRLHGTSETVPGDDYTLWLYVPQGVTVARVHALAANQEIRARHELTGNSLRVSFPGQREAVSWEVVFSGKSNE